MTRKEQGEARRRRALEVFGSWCPQVGEVRQRVNSAARAWNAAPLEVEPKSPMQWLYVYTGSCCFPLLCLQVRSLVEAADPLALTEHGQFYRQPEACKVRGRLAGAHSKSVCRMCLASLAPPSRRLCHATLSAVPAGSMSRLKGHTLRCLAC